jgi:hypothetical protein
VNGDRLCADLTIAELDEVREAVASRSRSVEADRAEAANREWRAEAEVAMVQHGVGRWTSRLAVRWSKREALPIRWSANRTQFEGGRWVQDAWEHPFKGRKHGILERESQRARRDEFAGDRTIGLIGPSHKPAHCGASLRRHAQSPDHHVAGAMAVGCVQPRACHGLDRKSS